LDMASLDVEVPAPAPKVKKNLNKETRHSPTLVYC
jgi:hypothetical protein